MNLPLDLLEHISDSMLIAISDELDLSTVAEDAIIREFIPTDAIAALYFIELNVIVRIELAKRFKIKLKY